ncbi:MAG TPA: flagellar basal-body MS-ring/collar protein FliF [Terriglobia bacterium]|nr:flagellar basal-body MS-ring/collar protein FliF [Terriglobia bacterium]
MPLDQKQLLNQASNFYRGLSRKQLYLLIASAIAVLGSLWLFVSLLGRGDYKALYTGLSPEDVQSITQRLAAENVPFQLSSDRKTLSVPAGKLDKVRLELAAQGLPVSGRVGFELFDKPDWAGSDFYEKVNYQRALEGELERTIEQLSDVESARVHLALPHESLFTEQERPAKASVLVKLRGDRLSEQSFRAITYLTASAVDGLKPENVTVVDANGYTPITYRDENQPWSAAGGKLETQLEQKINQMLAPIVGIDHVRSSVTVDFDTASSDTTQETYDPNGSVVLTSQTTYESDSNSTAQGIPGTASNVPQGQPAPPGSKSPANSQNPPTAKASSAKADPSNQPAATSVAKAFDTADNGIDAERTESKTYAVSRTLRHSTQPPGTIKRVSAVVLVDDAAETKMAGKRKEIVRRPLSAAEMKQIEDITKAAIGFNSSRGDQVAVENIGFTSTPSEFGPPPSTAEKVLMRVNQYMGLIRYLALGLLFLGVYFLILRPLMKPLLASLQQGPRALKPGERAGLGSRLDVSLGEEAQAPRAMLTPPPAAEEQAQAEVHILSRRTLADKIEKDPEEASRLLQDWLIEDEGA